MRRVCQASQASISRFSSKLAKSSEKLCESYAHYSPILGGCSLLGPPKAAKKAISGKGPKSLFFRIFWQKWGNFVKRGIFPRQKLFLHKFCINFAQIWPFFALFPGSKTAKNRCFLTKSMVLNIFVGYATLRAKCSKLGIKHLKNMLKSWFFLNDEYPAYACDIWGKFTIVTLIFWVKS